MVLKKLAAIIAIALVSLAVASCGSSGAKPGSHPTTATIDRYLGTWTQTAVGAQQQEQMSRILVKKVGDKYAFTDPAGEASKLAGLQTDADSSGNMTLLAFEIGDKTLATGDGDHLTLTHSGHTFTITVNGDTMTWTEMSNVYHFVRAISN